MARNVTTDSAALARTNRAASDGLENFVAGLGTDRDKRAHSSYGFVHTVSRPELEAMYRSSWLAKRVVNTVADDMTREGWTVEFDDPDGEGSKALARAEKRLQVTAKINSALRWARLYGGCIVVMGTKGQKLNEPLDPVRVRRGDLRYLQVLDRWRCAASPTLTTDLEDPNFGLPEYFIVAESSVQVHHSRVLRFDGPELPYFQWRQNAMWHDSELQHTYGALMDVDATTAALASMMFEANVDVVTSEGLNDVLATKDGEARVTKRYRLAGTLKAINRLLLLDGKEKYEKKGNSFANLDKVLDKFMDNVCGASEIPRTRLFGQSAAGLNATGEGDEKNYHDVVSNKQETDLRPQLDRLYAVLGPSTLGAMPDDFEFDFNPLKQISDKEQAAIDYQRAQTDDIYFAMGVLDEAMVGRSLKTRGTYALTDEDIDMLEELAAEPPAPPDGMTVDPKTGALVPLPAPSAVEPGAQGPSDAG
jgi:uncharacterized protein